MRITKLIGCLAFLCNASHCAPFELRSEPANPGLITVTIENTMDILAVIAACREHNFAPNAMSALLEKFEKMRRSAEPTFVWQNTKPEDCLEANTGYVLSRITRNGSTLEVPYNVTLEELIAFNISPDARQAILLKAATEDVEAVFSWSNTVKKDRDYAVNIFQSPQDARFVQSNIFYIATRTPLSELLSKFSQPIADGILRKIAANPKKGHIVWNVLNETDLALGITFENDIYTIKVQITRQKNGSYDIARAKRAAYNVLHAKNLEPEIEAALEVKIIKTIMEMANDKKAETLALDERTECRIGTVTLAPRTEQEFINKKVHELPRTAELLQYAISKDVTFIDLINAGFKATARNANGTLRFIQLNATWHQEKLAEKGRQNQLNGVFQDIFDALQRDTDRALHFFIFTKMS